MTRVLLARHGETDWNRDGRWQGHSGPGLNDRGRLQARSLAERLQDAGASVLYTSDLQRAVETADILAKRTNLTPVLEPGLREVHVGSWAGLTRAEVAAVDPDGLASWFAGDAGWSDGESYDQMHLRVVGTVERLLARHPGETLLVVAHGGTVRALAAHAAGLAAHDRRRILGAGNCSLTVVETGTDGRLALCSFNDEGHLVRGAASGV